MMIATAGSGIGLAIAGAFLAAGHKVHSSDIDSDALGEASTGNSVLEFATQVDVTDEAAVGHI